MARIAVVALGAVLAFLGVRLAKRSRAAKRADGTLSGASLDARDVAAAAEPGDRVEEQEPLPV